MATETKKSSILTDDDYRSAKVWSYDQKALIRRTMDLGGPYEGINEAVQNAFDSPLNRLKDKLRIDITIPTIDMPKVDFIARVQDTGGSVTKDFNGDISGFVNRIRAISPKANHRFGMGMGQYYTVSQTFVITSMDDKAIYRIPCFKNSDGLPVDGHWTFDLITEANKAKHNIFSRGTMTTWYDEYENSVALDPVKVGNEIKKVFGWRMLEQTNTEVYVNGEKLEIPETLQGKQIKFICKLKQQEVEQANGTITKVDPIVMGFIEANKKGTGTLEVYAFGGYYYGKVKYANKRFSGAISIDVMPLDSSRRVITHEAMRLDLERHIIEETKHFEDIPQDGDVTEKQHKTISDLINKITRNLNIPKLQIQKFESIKREMKEALGNPNEEGKPGYRKAKEKIKTKIELCNLCNHRKVKNTRGERKGCECDCHIPREKGPDEHVSTVGCDGEIEVLIEHNQIESQKKRTELEVRLLKTSPETEPLLTLHPLGYLDIVTKNPLFKQLNIVKHPANMIPFFAPIILELEQPKAFLEKTPTEYRKLIEDYTIKLMDEM